LQELIEKGRYDSKYDFIYRNEDVKDSLFKLYNRKCVYCESRLSGTEIEHYRNKSTYYWLAFSWDNLFPICSTCNRKKGAQFQVNNVRSKAPKILPDNFHTLSAKLNEEELPDLIHSELDNPELFFIFSIDGLIDSSDSRGKYTITSCGLDRKELTTNRKAIIDELKKELNCSLLFNENIESIIRSFRKKAMNNESDYSAFRRFVVKMYLKEILSSL